MTLRDHHTTKDFLLRMPVLIGHSRRRGKSTTARLMAKDYCADVETNLMVFTKQLDPLGLVTKGGGLKRAGCIVFTDMNLETRLQSELYLESLKSLTDIIEGAAFPPRYHAIIFEPHTPRILAVNEDWPRRQNLPWLEELADGKAPTQLAPMSRNGRAHPGVPLPQGRRD